MSSTELTFKLTKDRRCPFYKAGDEFRLSGNALGLKFEKENTFISTTIVRFPENKEICRTLIGDLTNILIRFENIDKIPQIELDCSGCEGSIRIHSAKQKSTTSATFEELPSNNLEIVVSLLSNFSIFQSFDEYNLKNIISMLKLKKYPKGTIVIKKGDPAQSLHIILSGAVEVLDENGVCLSTLRKGDIFGEMSLISGEPVGATIKVVKAATMIFIGGQDFKEILHKFSSVQMYLTRILAKRLANANIIRTEEIAYGMTGQLSEMALSEILQTLNLSQKTGVLSLTLTRGSAKMYLKDGNLVKADYNNLKGKAAIFEILKEREGRFNFKPSLPAEEQNAKSMGPLMEILLETSKRMDEKN